MGNTLERSDGTNVTSLSDDLLIEILNRLPLKSLLGCKSVSKSWHQLISQDCIRKRQPLIISGVFYLSAESSTNKDPEYGTTFNGDFSISGLDFFPFHADSIFVDSCNGLLLFYSFHPATICVCNPMIKKWVALPNPSKKTQLSLLAFDPYSSPHYKVISFTGWQAESFELEVFSSETSQWVVHKVQLPGLKTDSMSSTISYFDGTLHILAHPQHIVSLDLERMNCRAIELPDPPNSQGFIGKSGGCLHYASIETGRMVICMLKNWKWVMKYVVGIPETNSSTSPSYNFLALHPEMDVAYFWVPGKIVACDLKNSSFSVVCELREGIETAYVIKMWLFPLSRLMTNCLTKLE